MFILGLVSVSTTVSVGSWLRHSLQERKICGSNPTSDGIFPGRVIPVTSKLTPQWLPCHASGIIGSALGLVGPMSVYCDCEVESLIRNFYLSVAAMLNCLSRSVPEIHLHVAGTLGSQQLGEQEEGWPSQCVPGRSLPVWSVREWKKAGQASVCPGGLCQCGPSVNGRRLAKPVCAREVSASVVRP